MKIEKYLPIGSVVLLKGAKKRIVVIGYGVQSLDDNKIYDYSACPYPEGVISPEKGLLFNHEQIEDVYYIGYNDVEWRELNPKIDELIKKARTEGTVK